MTKRDKMIFYLDTVGLCLIIGGLVVLIEVDWRLGVVVQAVAIGFLLATLTIKALDWTVCRRRRE